MLRQIVFWMFAVCWAITLIAGFLEYTKYSLKIDKMKKSVVVGWIIILTALTFAVIPLS